MQTNYHNRSQFNISSNIGFREDDRLWVSQLLTGLAHDPLRARVHLMRAAFAVIDVMDQSDDRSMFNEFADAVDMVETVTGEMATERRAQFPLAHEVRTVVEAVG